MSDVTSFDPLQHAPLPIYGSWSAADYAALGFKVGLEVHQQLLTDRKLFCRCPAGLYSKDHDVEILRHMRPTLSEMGDYDGTALMEFKTRKRITYLLDNDSVCTYEMDDAPPFEMDPRALDISILISLMLGLQVVDEIHIARKQYLDGSIPTGFQRTAITGVSGEIPFGERRIGIRQLSIEEDSCREVTDRGHDRVYRTDRLGMPLIETVTEPDMRTPEDAAAVCELLRRLARASGLVRTGAGAGRQDVNVSIEGGTRIEIKGVASIKDIPLLVHNEALRQRSLLAIRRVLRERGMMAESIEDRWLDVSDILQGSSRPNLQDTLSAGGRALAVPLPGFEGLILTPTQPHTLFIKEFADRVRVVACLDSLPNLACSTGGTDILTGAAWDRVEKRCGVEHGTPVMVVWGPERDAETAAKEILIRARDAVEGVPSETRQSLPDGTNGFERILPGPSRMYPDTDLPPVVLTRERVSAQGNGLPPAPWERLAALRAAGVGEDLAGRLSIHPAYALFTHLHARLDGGPITPTGLASLLLDRDVPRPTSLKAADAWWERAVARVNAGEAVFEGIWCGEDEPPAALDDAMAKRVFAEELAALPSSLPDEPRKRELTVMGRVMKRLRGRVPGATVAGWVKEARP
ncbi:Glu-tRNA(Gln) amidotransferase subunit GatE [bacterium]|nr:Glu-tRNA(Gln) amidotransferase subunit GatE [bacterium]